MSDTHIQHPKIAQAITYLDEHFKEQPSLEQVADQLNLSMFHFQRLFKEWVGISPKKYLQYLTVNYAKSQLSIEKTSLLQVAADAGLSGTGRLHYLFVSVEGMTPGEYKNGGQSLIINYSFSATPFGDVVVASTKKGICYLAFIENLKQGLEELKQQFPNAAYQEKLDDIQKNSLVILKNNFSLLKDNNLNERQPKEIKLHLKGTDFQLKVWQALLTIPEGGLATYGELAGRINQPTAARAVGTAIGNNPIAYLIPCHRIIQSSGNTGGYRWNPIRKKALIGWEAAHIK